MGIPWIKKYEPRNTSEIVGQEEAIAQIRKFISEGRKNSALLYGETGCGKTISAYAIANEFSHEIIEVNASDFRNKEKIDAVIGNAMKQLSLFAKSKIILIDEIDGLSGTKDRGGIAEITKLIQDSKFPVILTANNPWDQKFSKLRNKCELIQFEILENKSVFKALERICKSENISYKEETLNKFARRAGSDLRAAINDLQSFTEKNKLDESAVEAISDRNRTEAITSALVKIFKTTDASIAVNAFDSVEEDMNKCILWIDENLPKEYTKPEDLARAYTKISKADVFMRRIKRRQHWRFLVYVNALLSAGIATSKDEKYRQFVKYAPTQRLLKIWRANMKYMKRKAIAEKIANATHSSVKNAVKDSFPFLRIILAKDKKLGNLISEELDLSDEEKEWMVKTS